jgi:hypothetical protein
MKTAMARNLPAQIIFSLGSQIVSGQVPAGTILTSESLEEKFGVSRTVIREALKVLHDKGLTRARTKIGTIVLGRNDWNLLDPDVIKWFNDSGLGPELVRDLEEVRASYEPWVARIAAKRRGTKDINNLNSAMKRMTDAFYQEGPDSPIIGEADSVFHQALLDATQNELMKQMGLLFIPLLRIREEMVRHVISNGEFLVAHQAIVDAIVDEDSDAAELAMRALLEVANRASATLRKKDRR